MATVELRGFPKWTEIEDLQFALENTGLMCRDLRLHFDKMNHADSYAVVSCESAVQAASTAQQLMGFEFTPGYPLEAYAIAAKVQTSQKPIVAKGMGKGPKREGPPDNTSAANCVGAGRIEGWFVCTKVQQEEQGWGQLESFSFEGPLVFRPAYSPLAVDAHWKPHDPVTFEVVQTSDGGKHIAVRLCQPGQEEPAEIDENDPKPWNDEDTYQVENYVAENRKWMSEEGEDMFRSLGPEDRNFVIASGNLGGCRDAKKVMYSRINSARAALGLPRQRGPDVAKKEYTQEDQDAWAAGRWDERLAEKKAEHERRVALGPAPDKKRHTRDTTWGNEEGTGCFVAGFTDEIDELMLQAYMERAGVVTFVKIFNDQDTGKPRGCGKVFFEDKDTASRAIAELHKTMFNGRPLSVQVLGDSKRRKRDQGIKPIEECPRTLPHFDASDSDEQKMDLCYASFEEMLVHHDAEATGKGLAFMVRGLVREVNAIFDGKTEVKKAFCARLGKHQWFFDNQQQCRWQQSKEIICVSKYSGHYERKGGKDGEGGKGFGKDGGKGFGKGGPGKGDEGGAIMDWQQQAQMEALLLQQQAAAAAGWGQQALMQAPGWGY